MGFGGAPPLGGALWARRPPGRLFVKLRRLDSSREERDGGVGVPSGLGPGGPPHQINAESRSSKKYVALPSPFRERCHRIPRDSIRRRTSRNLVACPRISRDVLGITGRGKTAQSPSQLGTVALISRELPSPAQRAPRKQAGALPKTCRHPHREAWSYLRVVA